MTTQMRKVYTGVILVLWYKTDLAETHIITDAIEVELKSLAEDIRVQVSQ